MNGERIPACPSFGIPMRFAKAISQADGPAELRTYDCKECGVAMTEAVDAQLASSAAADRTPIIGALLSHGLRGDRSCHDVPFVAGAPWLAMQFPPDYVLDSDRARLPRGYCQGSALAMNTKR